MKLIEINDILRNLNLCIEENVVKLALPEKNKQAGKSTQEAHNLEKQEYAATVIQRIWRKRKIKQAIVQSPYFTYLSLLDPNDEHHLLSSIMFGRHIAELQANSKERINNPYIHKGALYHRDDNLSGVLLDKLMQEFQIDPKQKLKYTYIPVTLLKNTPIWEIQANFFSYSPVQIIEDNDHSVGFIVLPIKSPHNEQIKKILRAAGLIASPWEIAVNIKRDKNKITILKKTNLDDKLPKTAKELTESNIYDALSFIAKDPLHPTQKLAICLQKVLKKLPQNIKPEAVQRIACMIDMANTFYEYDYPKFAFSVYATMHEISLALLEQKEESDLEQGFNEFLMESHYTLDKTLSIESATINKASFIASPAMSGTNAYMLAMQLALTMKVPSGKPPSVKVFKPSYYEFGYITKPTNDVDADIFVLSAGPIVNTEGLTPGIDINKFVRRNIIASKREKPTTLVIDTTSALYKNLHLEPEVQKLIDEGKLSIIIHESHQKFGMLHTDQAQYGRMMAICSKEQFDSDVLDEMQKKSQQDYKEHLDLRVGAYISATCSDTLENIKEQHFNNGALLRDILIQSSLASKEIVKHEDMLENLNELYFVTSPDTKLKEAAQSIIEGRDSFGHFGTALAAVVKQTRISPDASDNLDCLVQAAQIYLAYHFKPEEALKLLITHGQNETNLSIAEQVILMALANNVLCTLPSISQPNKLSLLFALNNLMEQCDALKGRQYYNRIAKSYFQFYQDVIDSFHVKNPRQFFDVTKCLIDKNIPLTSQNLHQLSNNEFIRKIIPKHHELLTKESLMAILELSEEKLNNKQIQLMIDNKPFCASVEKIHSAINEILLNLGNDPNKHQRAIEHSKPYFIACFTALEAFHNEPAKDKNHKKELLKNLNLAKENYCHNVLGIDKSASSQAVRYLLKGVINFIAALTFGAAHYIHYKTTGNALFFANTNSEKKLKQLHNDIEKEITSVKSID